MRTALSLSVKVVAEPSSICARPSGTDTVNNCDGGRYGTYTWVSGMSPTGLCSGATVFDVTAAVGGPAGWPVVGLHPVSGPTVASTTNARGAEFLGVFTPCAATARIRDDASSLHCLLAELGRTGSAGCHAGLSRARPSRWHQRS